MVKARDVEASSVKVAITQTEQSSREEELLTDGVVRSRVVRDAADERPRSRAFPYEGLQFGNVRGELDLLARRHMLFRISEFLASSHDVAGKGSGGRMRYMSRYELNSGGAGIEEADRQGRCLKSRREVPTGELNDGAIQVGDT